MTFCLIQCLIQSIHALLKSNPNRFENYSALLRVRRAQWREQLLLCYLQAWKINLKLIYAAQQKSILLTNERRQLSMTVDFFYKGSTDICFSREKIKLWAHVYYRSTTETTIINNEFILSIPSMLQTIYVAYRQEQDHRWKEKKGKVKHDIRNCCVTNECR